MGGEHVVLGAATGLVAVAEVFIVVLSRPRRLGEVLWALFPALAMAALIVMAWRVG